MNRLRKSERGAVAVLVGFLMVVLMGFIGMAVDIGYVYVQKARLQEVADAEALACVINPLVGQYCGASVAVSGSTNIYSVNPNLYTVSIQNPAYANPGDTTLCYDPATQKNCARAVVSTTWSTFFLSLFGFPQYSAGAVATAGLTKGTNQACIIASSASTAGNYLQGSAAINGSQCINYFGNITITGNSAAVTGSKNFLYNNSNVANCGNTCTPAAQALSGPVPVPTITAPTLPGSAGTATNFTGSAATTLTCPNNQTCTLTPGRYNSLDCSGANSVCNLTQAGTYAFDGNVQGPSNNGTLNVTGLLYMNGTNTTLNLGGGGTLNMTTTNTGSCSSSVTSSNSVVIYSPNAGSFVLQGGPNAVITGNIYMPNYTVTFQGSAGATLKGTMVTQIYQGTGGGGGNGTDAGLSISGTNSCGFYEFSTVSLVN